MGPHTWSPVFQFHFLIGAGDTDLLQLLELYGMEDHDGFPAIQLHIHHHVLEMLEHVGPDGLLLRSRDHQKPSNKDGDTKLAILSGLNCTCVYDLMRPIDLTQDCVVHGSNLI